MRSVSTPRGVCEPGQLETEAALAAMSPVERLRLFWRAQEIAVARSWALVARSGLTDPRDRIGLVIRARYPEWSSAEVDQLLDAISAREDPATWLERLRRRARALEASLGEDASTGVTTGSTWR